MPGLLWSPPPRAREEKIRQQKMQQEERLARFQARSQSEIKKKVSPEKT